MACTGSRSPACHREPQGAAQPRPLARLQGKRALLCHLDVDVIDYAQFPLADCPRYHGGLSLPDAFDAVAAAAGHPGLACLTLTEVNPGHDPAGELAQGAGEPLGSRDRGRPDALTFLVPQRATFARFDACAIERAVGDGQASAVQGQTLAQVGHASRGDGASQVRWGWDHAMPRTDRASRVIAAPPGRVWAALVDPGALLAWLPPGG